MTIGERIRILRKSIPEYKTLEAFSAEICITPQSLSQAELGKNKVTDRVIDMICSKFGASEIWLRTGEGEMFTPKTRYDEISDFLGDLLKDQPDFRHRFVVALASMTIDEWALLERKIREITAEDEKKPDSQ